MPSTPEKSFLTLNKITVYNSSFRLSNYVWRIVVKWDYFAKNTAGTQFARSVDSISANIAEGFGRYFKKDKIKFYRYSFASTLEAQDWAKKAAIRKLLTPDEYKDINSALNELPKGINHLINFTRSRLKQ